VLILVRIDSFAFPSDSAAKRRSPARARGAAGEWARLVALFRAELAEGCENRAISGGLDRLLVNLVEGGRVHGQRDLLRRVRALPDAGYRALNVDQREAWVRGTARRARGARRLQGRGQEGGRRRRWAELA